MNKKLTGQLREKLEKEKISMEAELNKFAEKDQNMKGDWDTKYPKLNGSSSQMEEVADEVEEYATLLPIEHSLELRVQNIDKALDKIKKGTYGKCAKCGKPISDERLEAYPAAELCSKCQK